MLEHEGKRILILGNTLWGCYDEIKELVGGG